MMNTVIKLGTLATVLMAAGMAFAQDDDIPVMLNGKIVQFSGQGPVMSKDRVMVPLRGVLERMGATVNWDPTTRTVYANKDATTVKLEIGDRMALVNGNGVNMDVPAEIMDGYTMVPLRFVSENLGMNVRWNEKDQRVEIATNDYVVRNQKPLRDDNEERAQRLPTPGFIPAGSIIEATLNIDLDSVTNHKGDRITADVEDVGLGLPKGTRLVGSVDAVERKHSGHPGSLTMHFSKLVLPSGKSYPVMGAFVGEGEIGSNKVHEAHFDSGSKFKVKVQDVVHLD
jgi:hypothetical protein